MGNYHRLTREDRYQIAALKGSGLGIREIGRALNRSASTISRELINTNSYYGHKYNPDFAHKVVKSRRKMIHPPRKVRGEMKEQVVSKLNLDWSPEQVAGRLKLEGTSICHETIYQYIYRDYRSGGKLWKRLPRKKRRRVDRLRAKKSKNKGKRINREWIDERPKIVETRTRLGDFERDLIIGKGKSPVLLTIVDRTTRLSKIALLEKICMVQTHEATVKLLKNLTINTITNDNGPEFSLHEDTALDLKARVYFCNPYHSWERGTNENTNGLIRRYLPKGSSFMHLKERDVKRIERLLNSRPRKCLSFKTPYEVQEEKSRMLQ